MNLRQTAVVTVTLARDEEEEASLKKALQVLAGLRLPVFVTDGGSSPDFLSFLRNFSHFTVDEAKGLWPQAKKSISRAVSAGHSAILYSEPDKETFFAQYLLALANRPDLNEECGVVVAARSAEGFATFPLFQQMTETTINRCCAELTGTLMDYCYGPFLFNSRLAPFLDALPATCGWGWRPYLFALAHRLGHSVESFEGPFACPPDQRHEDERERMHRVRQLAQNIDGLLRAAAAPLP